MEPLDEMTATSLLKRIEHWFEVPAVRRFSLVLCSTAVISCIRDYFTSLEVGERRLVVILNWRMIQVCGHREVLKS